jgi:hypothetical protein
MAAGHQNLEQSNRQLEEKVNKMFKEKRELEHIIADLEKQVEDSLSGNTSPELQSMSRELESIEAQPKELRAQTGDLQGKSREELLQLAKKATTAIGDTEQQLQEEQKALHYVQNQLRMLDQRDGDMQTEQGQKYLKLLQREKETNRFIQNYPGNGTGKTRSRSSTAPSL